MTEVELDTPRLFPVVSSWFPRQVCCCSEAEQRQVQAEMRAAVMSLHTYVASFGDGNSTGTFLKAYPRWVNVYNGWTMNMWKGGCIMLRDRWEFWNHKAGYQARCHSQAASGYLDGRG